MCVGVKGYSFFVRFEAFALLKSFFLYVLLLTNGFIL